MLFKVEQKQERQYSGDIGLGLKFLLPRVEMLAIVCSAVLNHVRLFATPWTVARQVLLSMGILQARILELVVMPSSRRSS